MKLALSMLLLFGACAHRSYTREQRLEICQSWFKDIRANVSQRADRLSEIIQPMVSDGASTILAPDIGKASDVCYDKFIRSSSNWGYVGCYHIAINPQGQGEVTVASHGEHTPSPNAVACLKEELAKIDFSAARRPSHGDKIIDVFYSTALSPSLK